MSVAVPRMFAIGLVDVISRGDLKRRTGPAAVQAFRPTAFDLNLLAVAEAAVATRVPTALVLPVVGTYTGVLLAASILVSHFVRTGRLSAQVALVTKQLRLRSFYDTLEVGRRGALADYFPRTVVLADGTASMVGKRSPDMVGYPGRLHFASDLARVPGIRFRHAPGHQGLDGVVIESQAADEQGVRQLLGTLGRKVPLLYLTVDPYDPNLPDFDSHGAVWAWDAASLTALVGDKANPDAICADFSVLKGAAHSKFSVTGPDEPTGIDTTLARLWDDLAELQRHSGGPGLETVQWAWGVIGALSQLPTPVDDYDRFARSAWGTTAITEAPGKAARFARNALGAEDREYWDVLAEDFNDAVTAAVRTNAKPAALATWVREQCLRGEPGVVVVRNLAAAHATQLHLRERTDVPFNWERYVVITTAKEMLTRGLSQPAKAMAVTGPVASRYAALFALPVAESVTVLTHGPWETARGTRQIEQVHARLEGLVRGPTRSRAVDALFRGTDPGPICNPLHMELSVTTVAAANAPPSARQAVWDPFDVRIVGSIGRDDADSEGPVQSLPGGFRAAVPALPIRFERGWGFFEPGCLVSKVEGGDLREVAAKSLAPNDRIVLVDHGAQRDLFDLIVEKLEDLPEFAAIAMLVHEWHRRARQAGFTGGHTYEEILRRMGGASITSPATIGTWVRGTVHGPLDPEDIRRFGQAVGDAFLTERWEAIGRALTTMRSHRRKIGRMLAHVLAGISADELEDQGYFDRRLGIHYSDFTEAISDHIVREVGTELQEVPYQYANRLLAAGDVAQLRLKGRVAA